MPEPISISEELRAEVTRREKQIEAISKALNEMVERFQAIEGRLAKIEAAQRQS